MDHLKIVSLCAEQDLSATHVIAAPMNIKPLAVLSLWSTTAKVSRDALPILILRPLGSSCTRGFA